MAQRHAQCRLVNLCSDSLKSVCSPQEDTPVREPVVEEYEDDLLEDLYHNLSVSTVTVGPNVTEYEVG